MADRSSAHLTDLIERVLPITARVFEVVVCRKGTVNVTSDGTVLWGFLIKDKREREKENFYHEAKLIVFNAKI